MTSREQNDDISKDELDGIRRGLDDVANGRVRPLKEIQAELENDGRGDVRGIGAETTETDAQRGWPKDVAPSSDNTSNPVHIGNTTPPLSNERPSEKLAGKCTSSSGDTEETIATHAVPTPVPLEAREWLEQNFVPNKEKNGIEVAIVEGKYVCLRRRDGGAPCKFSEALESYSSHVNAALMEKLAKYMGWYDCAQQNEEVFKKRAVKLEAAILDIDAHAAPLGHDADGFVQGGYYISVGCLHRALGLVGHSSAKCKDVPCERSLAAESRISELERERDEARELVDGLRIMYEAEVRVHNRTYELWTAVESQLSTTQEAIRKLYANASLIDNGHCTVCGFGYRTWKLPKCKIPTAPCTNEECLSHEIERVLSPPTKLP